MNVKQQYDRQALGAARPFGFGADVFAQTTLGVHVGPAAAASPTYLGYGRDWVLFGVRASVGPPRLRGAGLSHSARPPLARAQLSLLAEAI